jgi:hypothetical protein
MIPTYSALNAAVKVEKRCSLEELLHFAHSKQAITDSRGETRELACNLALGCADLCPGVSPFRLLLVGLDNCYVG